MKYLKISEYADKYSISAQSVYKAVRAGKLKKIKNRGATEVEDIDVRSGIVQDNVTGDLTTTEKVMLARLKKIEIDTEYQQQRISEKKEEILREYTEKIIENYIESYAVLKNEIINLRLTQEQNNMLQDLFSRCSKNFIGRLKRLKEKNLDNEQEK